LYGLFYYKNIAKF